MREEKDGRERDRGRGVREEKDGGERDGGKKGGSVSWEVTYMRFPHSLQGDGKSFVRVASVSRHMSQEHLQETDMRRGAAMSHQCLQR